jgi:hypothetical protein
MGCTVNYLTLQPLQCKMLYKYKYIVLTRGVNGQFTNQCKVVLAMDHEVPRCFGPQATRSVAGGSYRLCRGCVEADPSGDR